MPISQRQKLRMGWVWAAPVGPMGLTCRSPLVYPLTRCGVSLTCVRPAVTQVPVWASSLGSSWAWRRGTRRAEAAPLSPLMPHGTRCLGGRRGPAPETPICASLPRQGSPACEHNFPTEESGTGTCRDAKRGRPPSGTTGRHPCREQRGEPGAAARRGAAEHSSSALPSKLGGWERRTCRGRG